MIIFKLVIKIINSRRKTGSKLSRQNRVVFGKIIVNIGNYIKESRRNRALGENYPQIIKF